MAKRAGGEDGVAHAVDDFFVGGTDSGQHAAEGGLGRVKFAVDEVVRAESHAALHRLRLAKLERGDSAHKKPGRPSKRDRRLIHRFTDCAPPE